MLLYKFLHNLLNVQVTNKIGLQKKTKTKEEEEGDIYSNRWALKG
jgi:hypothetical protein